MAAKTRRLSSGTISFDTNVSFVDDVVKVTTTDLTTKDRLITLNKGGSLGSNTSGIEIESGGSIVATIGYTDSGGWNFGNRNITTTGTVTGSLSLTANSVNDTHIDFGTSANQVSTADIPEQTNLYYTSARANADFDTRLATKSTTNLSEGTNLYFTNARADARITNALIDEDNMASNSATKLPSQQSVKAYVDAQILTKDNTDEIAEGSSNLYFTNTRVESYLGTVSFDKHQDVNFTSLANDDILQYNTGSSKWENKKLGYTVANWIVDNDTATSSVSGATLGSEAASGLSSAISVQDASTKIRVTAQVRFTGSSTGSSDINIRLYRNKGGSPEALLSEWTAEDCNSTAKKFTASFDFYDTPGTVAAHTYSVYYHASDNNATLTPNPAFSTGSGTPANYIQAIEVLVNSSILANIVEDTTPQLGGVLDAQTNKIQNLGTPTAGTDAATKTYVDTQVASENTIAEMNDVDTTGIANNKILKYNSTSSKWEISDDNYDDGLNNVNEDTSPELGGHLNASNFDIVNARDGDFGGNVIINGNLTVSGDTTTVDVTQLEVEDPMIYLNRSGQENSATYDSGILIERYDGGNQNHAGMIWDESADEFAFFTSPNITASTTTVTGMVYSNVRAGDVKTKNILPDANTTYDIGSSSAKYNTVYAKATSAQYADLAELYRTDKEYEPGTVLIFGGEAEVTESTEKMDHRVAGVVSLSPAYLMNSTEQGLTSPVALRGKVQVNVIGPVKKGDLIVTSDTPGVGQAHPSACSSVYVIGKCIEDDDTENLVRLITCVI
tara:strand:+ start:1911 stop:4271 length:2361 start_codon:yes stop_codon:yes gene_type:complete